MNERIYQLISTLDLMTRTNNYGNMENVVRELEESVTVYFTTAQIPADIQRMHLDKMELQSDIESLSLERDTLSAVVGGIHTIQNILEEKKKIIAELRSAGNVQ